MCLTSTAGNIFGSATSHDKDPTAVVVYSGGATIETEAANAVWTAPLVRPTGQSITSITLPADVLSPISYKKMIGPPRIVIGGNGHGATAIADYDDATRTVKGVIVTSPGYGYDGETTVTVDSWDRKSTLPCTYTLGEVAGGGFTKKGGGKLTLGGANTYAGGTTVAGGTLAFSDAAGFPAGGDLTVSNGASVVLSAATTVDKRGPGAVRFEGPVAPWNGTMMVNRGEVVLANDAQAAPAFALSGSATFAKEGAKEPPRYPRPWETGDKQRIGSGAIPISEFDKWYYGGDA